MSDFDDAEELLNSSYMNFVTCGDLVKTNLTDPMYKKVWSVLSEVTPEKLSDEKISDFYRQSDAFKNLFHVALFVSFDIIYTYISRLLTDVDVELGNYEPSDDLDAIYELASPLQIHLFLGTMSCCLDEFPEDNTSSDHLFLNICHNLTGFVYSELIKKINQYELVAMFYLCIRGIDYSSGVIVSDKIQDEISKKYDLNENEWPDSDMFEYYFHEHPDEFEAFFEDNKDDLINYVINNGPFSLSDASLFLEYQLNHIILRS